MSNVTAGLPGEGTLAILMLGFFLASVRPRSPSSSGAVAGRPSPASWTDPEPDQEGGSDGSHNTSN